MCRRQSAKGLFHRLKGPIENRQPGCVFIEIRTSKFLGVLICTMFGSLQQHSCFYLEYWHSLAELRWFCSFSTGRSSSEMCSASEVKIKLGSTRITQQNWKMVTFDFPTRRCVNSVGRWTRTSPVVFLRSAALYLKWPFLACVLYWNSYHTKCVFSIGDWSISLLYISIPVSDIVRFQINFEMATCGFQFFVRSQNRSAVLLLPQHHVFY